MYWVFGVKKNWPDCAGCRWCFREVCLTIGLAGLNTTMWPGKKINNFVENSWDTWCCKLIDGGLAREKLSRRTLPPSPPPTHCSLFSNDWFLKKQQQRYLGDLRNKQQNVIWDIQNSWFSLEYMRSSIYICNLRKMGDVLFEYYIKKTFAVMQWVSQI